MSKSDPIDWQAVDQVVVLLRRADHYDPDPYRVVCTQAGDIIPHWMKGPRGRHRWEGVSGTIRAAIDCQKEVADGAWLPVAVEAADETLWALDWPDGIDADYADALHRAGLYLEEDVRRHDDLTDLDGIGQAGAAQIREAIE